MSQEHKILYWFLQSGPLNANIKGSISKPVSEVRNFGYPLFTTHQLSKSRCSKQLSKKFLK